MAIHVQQYNNFFLSFRSISLLLLLYQVYLYHGISPIPRYHEYISVRIGLVNYPTQCLQVYPKFQELE